MGLNVFSLTRGDDGRRFCFETSLAPPIAVSSGDHRRSGPFERISRHSSIVHPPSLDSITAAWDGFLSDLFSVSRLSFIRLSLDSFSFRRTHTKPATTSSYRLPTRRTYRSSSDYRVTMFQIHIGYTRAVKTSKKITDFIEPLHFRILD